MPVDYKPKDINFGFVILSPEFNIGRIKTTFYSIKYRYPGISIICIVPSEATSAEIDEIKELCPVHKGGKTITSLINMGMKKGNKEWNFLVMESTSVQGGLHYRYSKFMEDEKDVLFPVILEKDTQGKVCKLHISFIDASLNGLCIHQKTFKEVGNFGDNPLEIEKTLWATTAMKKGCRFKGLVGVRLL
jgi:hypothetical protein